LSGQSSPIASGELARSPAESRSLLPLFEPVIARSDRLDMEQLIISYLVKA